ncbi:MAG: hypothetical protein Q9208_004250 [Pyrenodesmia sp. 3 TL-2023]
METDIAIIGMACRVAGAKSPDELWKNLLSSKDVQRRMTRFNIDGFYHPAGGPVKGLTNVDRAYMLDDDDVDKFDNAFFHVTPSEATAMDPQQRMLLEVSYEAIENAGIPLEDFVGTDTATGVEGSDYHSVLARDLDVIPKYIVTGTAGCMASNRLSYFYDLSGPSMSVDTACSSSMTALHQAVRTLQHGDSTMALVCGSNLILNPESFISMTELGFIGSSGRCRSFDALAEGYGRGEGVGAVLLKTFKKAVDDHDPIRAIIKGTRLNQDGRTQGITLPSALAQQGNMESLYKELNIDPSSIQYLEAHGTGTAAGDPLEMQAVNAVYGENPLTVGSVKSNLGHCEAASALIGLIKTVLCLENAQIPAQMYFETPNPAIDFSHRTIPTKTMDWPDTNRRAAINTFGAGGTNGHAVLEAYHAPPFQTSAKRPWLFKVSAADEMSLQALSREYARSSLRYTRFLVASNENELITELRHDNPEIVATKSGTAKVLFVLTGQGAQWAQMGRALLEGSPLFENTLQECDDVLKTLGSWSLIEALTKAKEESNVDMAEYSQPLCTALQIGIVSLLRSWDIEPDAVVGHSSGEIAAAFAAGMISLRTAMIAAYYRGYVLANSATPGSMCAVGTGEDECVDIIQQSKGRVQLAAVNSPRSCTLSGDSEAIQNVLETCGSKGLFCRLLKVDRAYHSHQMLPLAPHYERYLEEAGIGPLTTPPRCAMFSSVTGKSLKAGDLTPAYWVRNMTSTVLFRSAIEESMESHIVLEVGPHPALKGPIQEIFASPNKDLTYFNTCKRGIDDFRSILESTGKMIAAGIRCNLRAVNSHYQDDRYQHGDVLTDLPSYSWNHSSSFWSEGRLSRKTRFRAFPRHELLGSRCGDDIPSRACWRNHLNLGEIEWLQCNQSPGPFPAIYILMATEAARQLLSPSVVRVTNLEIVECPVFTPSRTIETRFITSMTDTFVTFELHFLIDDEWRLLSKGNFELSTMESLPRFGSQKDLPDDPVLLQKARACYPHIVKGTEKMNNGIVLGTQSQVPASWQKYPIEPGFLASLLSLGPTTLLDQSIPVSYRVVSVEELYVCVKVSHRAQARFSIESCRIQAGGARSLIDVDVDSDRVLAGKIRYEATGLLSQGSVASSLFFKPVCLPDITKNINARLMSIERILQLLCHKWPMCDIKIDDIPLEAQQHLLESLVGQDSRENTKFRSIVMRRAHDTGEDERIRIVDDFENDLPAHMLFAGQITSVDALSDQLQPFGLACIQQLDDHLEQQLRGSFENVCGVTGLNKHPWILWRKKVNTDRFMQKRKRIIFSPRSFSLMEGSNIPLEPQKAGDFASMSQLERFDVIVVDDPVRSIVTGWSGKDLIPWLQHLMKHADSLLWVSRNAPSGPFVNVSGTLLRTMQAEQPSLKVCWLSIDATDIDDVSLMKDIEKAFQSMQQGDNELRLAVDNEGTSITRYLPDGELSLATGVSLPRLVQEPLDGRDYELIIAAPGEPVVLSHDSRYLPKPENARSKDPAEALQSLSKAIDAEENRIKVTVISSLISNDDLAAYKGESDRLEAHTPQLGTFFAGRAVAPGSPTFAHVVGWTPHGAHANTVYVPETNLYQAGVADNSRNVAEFASLATAMAVIDGRIRARKEDQLQFTNVEGMLKEAFMQACRHLHVGQAPLNHHSPTFVIEVSDYCVLVDGVPVDIIHYLRSRPAAFVELWKSHRSFNSSWRTFDLNDYKMAFDSADIYSTPAVLDHNPNVHNIPHVPIYRQPCKLAQTSDPPEAQDYESTGAYIIIGGLGGLGRYVCSWLVAQGAKTLYAISRSGISSPEAQQLHSNLTSTPTIHFRVIKADACDRPVMSSVLASIRAKHPIKGIINMAMILGDAPLASMTGEEWDRALRVKIDSSWILHELTAYDDLDHFILFSSIASVLGNRGQGGYNVGNAFLNALAVWRRQQGKVGISVALGAMTDIGVLADLPDWAPDRTATNLARSGLSRLTTPHLAKILEAAFLKSRWQREGREMKPEEALVVTGLEMFEKEADGSLLGQGRVNGERLFWTELPEFSHLSRYRGYRGEEKEIPLKERVESAAARGSEQALRTMVKEAVLGYLSRSLGFRYEAIDPTQPMGSYGLDSLNAVGCQFWCFKEMAVDVSIKEIFEANSIENFVGIVCERVIARQEKERE